MKVRHAPVLVSSLFKGHSAATMASRRILGLAGPLAGLGTATYLTSPLLLDDGRPVRPGYAANGDKLPIYPQPEPIVTLIETTSPLVPYIAQARVGVTDALSGVTGYVQAGVARWITFERRVEREVKAVLPPDESLNPGLIYVLISTLSASVLTRTRSFPVRFLAPPLFTLAAMPYFLPKTAHNLRAYLSDLEDKHLPEFAQSHDKFSANLEMHWDMLLDRLQGAGEAGRGLVRRGVEGVEQSTGLRVGDMVSKVTEAREAGQRAQQQVVEGDKVLVPVKTVGVVVEERPVAEIVVPVGEAKEVPGKRMV